MAEHHIRIRDLGHGVEYTNSRPGAEREYWNALAGAGRTGVKIHRKMIGGPILCNQRIHIIRAGYKARDFQRVNVNDFCERCFDRDYAAKLLAEIKGS